MHPSTTHESATASSEDRFLDVCQKLFAGAVNGQQYASAWEALERWFGASGVRLVRSDSVRPDGLAEHVLRLGRRQLDPLLVVTRAAPLNTEETAWMQLLLAPLCAALELGATLASPFFDADSGLQLTRLFPTPFILTDATGRCIERQQPFDRILHAVPGSVREGRLVFDDGALQAAWLQTLGEACRTVAPRSLRVATRAGEQWKVHVAPFAFPGQPPHGLPTHLTFALWHKDSAGANDSRTQSAFGSLTRAEQEVLASLLLGLGAKSIARRRGASVNTVRNQITSILAKTGHRSQRELMAFVSMKAAEDEFGSVGAIGANPPLARLNHSNTSKAAP